MTLEQRLEKIAQDVLGIDTLKTQNSDSLDFHEVSVWSLKQALEKAYALGCKHDAECKERYDHLPKFPL